jgi:hypothetical protein
MENKFKIMENPSLSYQDLLDKVQQYEDANDFSKAIKLLETAIKGWIGVKNIKYYIAHYFVSIFMDDTVYRIIKEKCRVLL